MTNLRTALRAMFWARHYQIRRDNSIHVYGVMPNTNQYGWYLFGYVGDIDTNHRLGIN